jgi:hypothetical protein
MFLSMPEFQFKVPEPLGAPGATFSRALTLATHAAWFVLSVRGRTRDASRESFLIAWDADVAHALETSDAELVSLMLVAPGAAGWVSRCVKEVWHATDPKEPETPAILMVDENGDEYSGFFMERAIDFRRDRLVARVGDPRVDDLH